LTNRKSTYDRLHTIHLWADVSIGTMALVGLLISDVLEAWYAIDLSFHIIIFTLATAGILAEKILHRGKHESSIFGSGLHRIHLAADVSISAMAMVGLLFAEVLELFFEADFVFHVLIFVLAIGGVLIEKFFHRHKHAGVIGS
jgi:general stress protein CsbA